MTLLNWVGRHASALLLLGFVLVPFLPVPAETFRPYLPALMVLVTALGFARQQLDRDSLRHLLKARSLGFGLAWLFVAQVVVTAVVFVPGHLLGLPVHHLMVVAVFLAGPTLSSAPNICLILGYDYTTALRLTVLGTLCAPVLVPLALMVSGLSFEAAIHDIALRVFAILLGGLSLGAVLQIGLGQDRIQRHGDAFNGLGALAMIVFLFPVVSGARDTIVANPSLALRLLGFAVLLNIFGNLLVRRLSGTRLPAPVAATLGYVFGNRNVTIVFASVPFDPVLALFVAIMQGPIYATPALFSIARRFRKPCPPLSES